MIKEKGGQVQVTRLRAHEWFIMSFRSTTDSRMENGL